jgi:YgiT-type zinc finger domain-containing protein
MKCFHCQAELKRGRATFSDSRKGYILALQDIPAWVCPQCGEPLFDADAVRRIQDVLRAIDEHVERLRHAA